MQRTYTIKPLTTMQYIYKFRVYYDEVEDFSRDIEILSSDNFESFHHILFSSIGLTGNELSSFFICDTKWNKQKEITLIDMGDDSEAVEPEYEEEEDFGAKSHLPKFVMKESVLKKFISDPHQHIIYEYDFLNPKTVYIELLKTLQAEDGVDYPRCTSSVKTLPKETPKNIHLEDPLDEFLEEEDDDMDTGYGDGLDEEDYSNMDGFGDFNEF